MGEFDLIEAIRRQAGTGGAGVFRGIGDDAAVLQLPAGRELVVTTDTLNAGVHFFSDVRAGDLGHKALAVNLSDLAAMGARPLWALLSLSMPHPDEAWVEAFAAGFLALAKRHDVALVGGDTCAGPLAVTVTALGSARPGATLGRNGARPGDLVVVSGILGNAALALERIGSGAQPDADAASALLRPIPRVALGAALVGLATSCIDISDGLLADLGHIGAASGCGAVIDLDALPCDASLAALEERERWGLQLSGGEDYELCFTLPPGRLERLERIEEATGIRLSVVGRMRDEAGVCCRTPGGAPFVPARLGYEHFK